MAIDRRYGNQYEQRIAELEDELVRWEALADENRRRAERAEAALSELVAAGEPYVGEAFPREELSGDWLRVWNRWLAAMNDARAVLGRGA